MAVRSWAAPRAVRPATGWARPASASTTPWGTVVGALAGAAISTVADSYVQDTTYTLVTDIQIAERLPGTAISQSEQANLQQGSSGTITQSSSSTTDAKRYRTRIVSTANQAHLDWPAAEPQLVSGLTRSLSGIF